MNPSANQESAVQALPPSMVWFMALACGLVVANVTYNQPMLAAMARDLGLSAVEAGIVPILTQLGYSVGMLVFVPLGDAFERRSLIAKMLVLSAGSLAFCANAGNALMLGLGSLAIGLTGISTHIMIPLAGALTPKEQRGRVVGALVGGLLTGVLASRALAGFVADHFGWRTMFWMASGFMLILAAVLATRLPRQQATYTGSYPSLFISLAHLVRELPVLRRTATIGACLLAASSALWATLVFFVEGSDYRYGSTEAGLFGLLGIVGAMAAPYVGRLVDRRGSRPMILLGAILVAGAFLLLGITGARLAGLIAGILLLDMGLRIAHVASQALIIGLHSQAQSRLNAIYMVSYFFGGAIGSGVGAFAWSHWGWAGVCGAGFAFALTALLLFRGPFLSQW